MTTITYRNGADEVVIFGGKFLRLKVTVNGTEVFNGKGKAFGAVTVDYKADEKGARLHKFSIRHFGAYGLYCSWQRGDETIVSVE